MTKGIKIILAIAGVLVLLSLIAALVQTWRLDNAQASITRVADKLKEAQEDAARWRTTAQARAVAVDAQAALADNCLKREAQAQADRDSIADIMATANPQPITPEQAKQGVDDATRIRAVDMLNRPW